MKETVLAGGEGRKRDSVTGFPQFVSLKQEKFALMSNFVESLPVQRTKKTEFSPCSQEFSVLVRCRLQAPKIPILDCTTRRRIQKRLLPRTNNSPACNTRIDTIRVRPAARLPAVSPCKKRETLVRPLHAELYLRHVCGCFDKVSSL